jgi:uncharacterized protein YndB with AHSA1/START domain
MTSHGSETRSVVIERDLPFPPEKIWRALTTPHLIEAWLMKNDFRPVEGEGFTLVGDWGSVACEVMTFQPHEALAYSWKAMGLESVVTWTLTPSPVGTHLRMEQAGFREDQERAYQGAQYGWKGFFEKLQTVLDTAA